MRTSTADKKYTERLLDKESAIWKRILNVQIPYRYNLRRLKPGFTLEIGSGIGRNLEHLRGTSVGIDHNPNSVEIARKRGLEAFTPDMFTSSSHCRVLTFDTLLLAHVAEHMDSNTCAQLISKYLEFLKPDGRIILITPQEAGYRSDSSHVEFMDFNKLECILKVLKFRVELKYSFPFFRVVGKIFPYNEFIVVGKKEHAV